MLELASLSGSEGKPSPICGPWLAPKSRKVPATFRMPRSFNSIPISSPERFKSVTCSCGKPCPWCFENAWGCKFWFVGSPTTSSHLPKIYPRCTAGWVFQNSCKTPLYPVGSRYDIFSYIKLILTVNVGQYSIHGSYGYWLVCLGTPMRGQLLALYHCLKVQFLGVTQFHVLGPIGFPKNISKAFWRCLIWEIANEPLNQNNNRRKPQEE